MFHDVRIGRQGADESMMVIIWYVLIDHLHDEGHFLAIIIEFHVVQLQVEDVPHATVDRFITHSIIGLSLGNPRGTTIGLETFLITKG